MSSLPPFSPDPDFRLPEGVREAFPGWVSARALERLLSALPKEEWSELCRALDPERSGVNSPVPGVRPTGNADWDRAFWDLYEDVRRTLEMGDDFPFPRPS